MESTQTLVTSVILLAALVVLLGSGIWVAISLLGVGMLTLALFTSSPVGSLVISTFWDASWSWPLTALPLFIWMGEILFRTRLSQDMFRGLGPWVSWLPGRLLHVNVLGCGVMAAVAGSSAVTCATIARMSLPELARRGYDEKMMIGTLAGSGTLGLLIPPSIIMIVYGVLAQVSVARLFIAGILPGLLLMVLFSGYVIVWAWLNPDKTPPSDMRMSLRDKLSNSRLLIPVLLLIAGVIGTIYGGYATPTEAAVIGVLGALALAAVSGTLSWGSFTESLLAATRTSGMIAFIISCAAVLSIAVGFVDIPRHLATWVQSMDLSPTMLLAVLSVFFVFLGCFLEGVSILVLSSAVVLPMVQAAGIDLLWFGIYMVILIEMAQITPPVGLNLFVLQSMAGRDIWQVTRATVPFFLLLALAIILIMIFPQIVTFLPQVMMSNR